MHLSTRILGISSAALLTTLASADTTTLVTTNPVGGGEYGDSVALVGDINGDSYPDVLVGAPDEDTASVDECGRVYVYSGKTGALIRTHVSPTPEIVGWYGEVVLGLPDINGDGRADYAIAAPNQGAGVEGDLYVYSGANGAQIYHLNGWSYRTFGRLSLVPDCTGDGQPELAVGYSGVGNYATVRIYQAKNGVLWKTLNSPIPMGDPSSFGTAVAGLPDVTGDGKGDVAVGAPDAAPSGPDSNGRVYVFNGVTGALYDTISSTDSQLDGRFGSSVAGIPDISGDGRGDIVIGADSEAVNGAGVTCGQVHVHSGTSGNWIRTLNSSDPEAGGDFGHFVASCGDINGDGAPDIVVGAPNEDVSATERGRCYQFSGSSGGLIDEFSAPGATAERFGDSLDASQDVNKDGKPDLIVGAPSTDAGGFAAAGSAFLYRTLENDTCALLFGGGGPITVGNGTHDFSTVGAGTSGSEEPECAAAGSSQIYDDVFYNYTATCTGTMTVSTCLSADFDTRIAVYLGCSFSGFPIATCNLSNIIDCNDDVAGCNFGSKVTVPVSAGQCYRIRIGGYQENVEGSGTFSISCTATCAGDLNGDDKVDASDLAVLLGQWGGSGTADLNGSGTVEGGDLAVMLGAWGNCP
jgi:FG-GAP repeat